MTNQPEPGSVLDRLDANKRKVADNDGTKTYSVEITETLQMTVDVRAKNAVEAEEMVRAAYDREEHVLGASHHDCTTFDAFEKPLERAAKRGGDAI
jgi:hypothetical protein